MAHRVIDISKYAQEIIDQEVDFVDVLEGGESVSSGSVEAYNNEGTDITTSLIPGGASVSTTKVTYQITNYGNAGEVYALYVFATLNTGEKNGQLLRLKNQSL